MAQDLPEAVINLLERCFGEDISCFTVKIEDNTNKNVDGFLSDIIYFSLTNITTNEETNLVVKKALLTQGPFRKTMSSVFQNEIYFYEKLWPVLQQFHGKSPNAKTFLGVPIFYGATKEEGYERILLPDLKMQNYIMHDKREVLEREKLEYIFDFYGQYHAISIAYREMERHDFFQYTKPLKNNFATIFSSERESSFMDTIMQKALDVIVQQKHKNEFERFTKESGQIIANCLDYDGKYPVLLHGDCWSNNMMFKYDENNEICDMKMVDFQMAMTGSAVFDLSLCFYTSVSGKEFNELDHYLRIYHKSLSESLKRYGCDAKKAYPYEILKSEWKKYCKFGFIMGIVLWTVKLEMSRDEVKVKEGSNEPILTIDEERFSEVINNLINHLGENDYL
ncbi:hypothetical protein JTB14_015095 [Gonioctena quinquepunctata]|nr:hypothetical protein JTB14_015095 [Gonioctena quinquepunctata]